MSARSRTAASSSSLTGTRTRFFVTGGVFVFVGTSAGAGVGFRMSAPRMAFSIAPTERVASGFTAVFTCGQSTMGCSLRQVSTAPVFWSCL